MDHFKNFGFFWHHFLTHALGISFLIMKSGSSVFKSKASVMNDGWLPHHVPPKTISLVVLPAKTSPAWDDVISTLLSFSMKFSIHLKWFQTHFRCWFKGCCWPKNKWWYFVICDVCCRNVLDNEPQWSPCCCFIFLLLLFFPPHGLLVLICWCFKSFLKWLELNFTCLLSLQRFHCCHIRDMISNSVRL